MADPQQPSPPTDAQPQKPAEQSWADVFSFPLACAGAIVGAAVGAMVVRLAHQSSLYAIPLIGLAAGWGATLAARRYNLPIGIIAALVTIVAQVLTEWKWLYVFNDDQSLQYFVQHVGDLPGIRLLLHGVGVVLAFWFGWRR